VCWKFQFSGQIGEADSFWGLRLHPNETEEVQHTTNVGNFLTFPRRGIAPDFDIGR
jgi:hypothetical protein